MASADPLTRARRTAARMDTHRAALSRLADERAEAVRDAVASGMTRSQVAQALGISKQALAQILSRNNAPADVLGNLRDDSVS